MNGKLIAGICFAKQKLFADRFTPDFWSLSLPGGRPDRCPVCARVHRVRRARAAAAAHGARVQDRARKRSNCVHGPYRLCEYSDWKLAHERHFGRPEAPRFDRDGAHHKTFASVAGEKMLLKGTSGLDSGGRIPSCFKAKFSRASPSLQENRNPVGFDNRMFTRTVRLLTYDGYLSLTGRANERLGQRGRISRAGCHPCNGHPPQSDGHRRHSPAQQVP